MQETKTISTYKLGLRDKILKDAMQSFSRYGIKAVKMDDIASHLSISKRTLYEIYETKEDLLFEGMKHYHEEVSQKMRQIGEESENVMEIILRVYRFKAEEFRQTNPLFYEEIGKYPHLLAYLENEKHQMRAHQMAFLQRGVDEGYFRDNVNFELVVKLFEAIGQYFMSEELYKQYSIEEIFNNHFFLTLRGLCTEKGIKAIEKFY